jgi:7,8-dihydro-6-hydroxymethylpterin-pyrophosphokinase
MLERPFVLEPLCELAPELRHPQSGESLAVHAARVRDPAAVRRREPGSAAG